MNSFRLDRPASATRVVVAMSGGVDSSVTAALLVEAGFEVIGVTLQLYDIGAATGRSGSCCAGQDIYDARRVADRLDIPHYVLDYEARFRSAVIDDFAAAYAAGETPVPCIRCNQHIKFSDLLDTAIGLGADALATGHYVRRSDGPSGPELHTAADADRDQSYFLFATTPAQLARLRFPVGGLPKAETRRLAARFALPVAAKADSQDICFVSAGRYADVVKRLRPDAMRSGQIVDTAGRVLGRHGGIGLFTVGQRRGLGIAGDEPLYVLRLEPEAARVVVGPKSALLRPRLVLGDVNWLDERALDGIARAVRVRLRSAMTPVAAKVRGRGGAAAEVELDEPYPGVAPGQACVFYDGTRVLGGGWIRRDSNTAQSS